MRARVASVCELSLGYFRPRSGGRSTQTMVDARCVPSLDIAIQYVSEGGASEQMRLVFGMRAPSTSLAYVGCGPDL